MDNLQPPPSHFARSTINTPQETPQPSVDSASIVAPSQTVVAAERVYPVGATSLGRDPAGLLSIAKTLSDLETAIYNADGELSPELEDSLSAVTIAKEKKIDSYVAMLDRTESIVSELKTKAQYLLTAAKTAQNCHDRLKDNIKEAAKILNVSEFSGEFMKIKISNSAPKLVVEDLNLVPEKYVVTETIISRSVDKEKLGIALAEGEKVPGIRWDLVKRLTKSAAKGLKK